jgi:hypothetical protein
MARALFFDDVSAFREFPKAGKPEKACRNTF